MSSMCSIFAVTAAAPLLHTELYLNARGLLTYTLNLTLVYSYDENLTAGLEEKGVCVCVGGGGMIGTWFILCFL